MRSISQEIQEANQRAVERMMKARPVLIDVKPAIKVVPGMKENMILHSGPPIVWDRMSEPQRTGAIGALLFERLADTPEGALKLIQKGEIEFSPCHHHSSVGSMAGITSASMPMFVVKNTVHDNFAYHQLYDGPSRDRLTMGKYSKDVIEHLDWLRDSLGPALGAGVRQSGGIDVKNIIARALTMGDECHNRCVAGTSRFVMELTLQMIRAGLDHEIIQKFLELSFAAEHSFLFVVMPACKIMADAAHGIEHSTIITTMARNGTDFGIRVSGLGDRWFTGPSPLIQGLYFPPYGAEDACPDMGDSAITETVGLGGFALATAPAMTRTVGGTVKDALKYTKEMREITVAENNEFSLPFLDFAGAATGIDVRKVVETGIVPVIDTGIAAKKGGQIGVGISRPPMKPFKDALIAIAEEFGQTAE